MPNQSSNGRPVLSSIIIGFSIIFSTIIAGWTFYAVRSFDNVLSVTGSARQSVKADQVKWTTNWSRVVYESALKSGYAQMDKDLTEVKAYFKTNGIDEKNITFSPVFMDQYYDYKSDGSNGYKQYTLRQSAELNSSDIDKVTALANNTAPLIGKGVLFSTNSLEYYYSKLADLRVNLISDAIKDARARAEKLAESSGQSVGYLKSASTGVVQVLSANSIEVSDYGSYDTSKIDKDVMLTVRASFTVR
ncbi:MAG: SIMPL domain-containing protein [Candidatus Paceibacterota bacterium]|jgi:hypothetical protein